MGLMMGPALAFRYYRDRFTHAESEHLRRAGVFLSAGWQAYLDRRVDVMMFRYADTVREMAGEIDRLRAQLASLEQQLAESTTLPRANQYASRRWPRPRRG
jgi:hypothetical protein